MIRLKLVLPTALLVLTLSWSVPEFVAADEDDLEHSPPVSFEEDVRPIFAERCVGCHGASRNEGEFRLDKRDHAFKGGGRGVAIRPGDPDSSLLVHAITGKAGDELTMPAEGELLTAAEKETVTQWIAEGAIWPDNSKPIDADAVHDHWAFYPVVRPTIPVVKSQDWPQNAIDFFVLDKLESAGVKPSPRADKTTLIRRLHLDLIGIPPTPDETDAFVNDARPEAYSDVVERLLASPHYGERWGRHWLDQARYADSHGYDRDYARPHAWRYRHWVVDAINQDMPYDQFTRDQLAGDLIPNYTHDILAATGFHRNTLRNVEAGADLEEDRVKQTFDRTDTTARVWMGLTVGCARCHSHKYDPVSQQEYYQLYAFFNSQWEKEVPAPLMQDRIAYQAAKEAFDAKHAPIHEERARFEREELRFRAAIWAESQGERRYAQWQVLTPTSVATNEADNLEILDDGSVLASGPTPETTYYTIRFSTDLKNITALRMEALPHESLPKNGPGRDPNGEFVLNALEIEIQPGSGGYPSGVSWVNPVATYSKPGWDISNVLKRFVAGNVGWHIGPQSGKRHVAIFEAGEPFGFEDGTAITIRLRQWADQLRAMGRVRFSVTTVPVPFLCNDVQGEIAELLAATDIGYELSEEEQRRVDYYYGSRDPDWVKKDVALLQSLRSAPINPDTTQLTQILYDGPEARETNVMLRGDFQRLGKKVEPNTPSFLPPLQAENERPNRMDLVRWLIRPDHPLTSRVAVNRMWLKYFGAAIVATDDDFGLRGDQPSHPRLLDYLATYFMESGWSRKAVHRLIVHSATYQQSSKYRPELFQQDSYNQFYARQQRIRLDGEIIRDSVLQVGGLLNTKIGGPSVRLGQPTGREELSFNRGDTWRAPEGAEKYRRSVYAWVQRTSPYPMFSIFDGADSNISCTRSRRSNTPLQSLVMMNNPLIGECATGLSVKLREKFGHAKTDEEVDEALIYAFKSCVSRSPGQEELEDLRRLYRAYYDQLYSDPAAALEISGRHISELAFQRAEIVDQAVWSLVVKTLMNLDEFITRE
ncbi:MAG: hypothetical protein ACI9HK_001098 [Pirellulaceae bacterium]|jgi:hypothetical protein